MKFSRITENQAYERIVEATNCLWSSGIGNPIFEKHPEFEKLKLNLKRCTTGGFGICGQGEYSGMLVTDGEIGYKVISMFVDALNPEDSEFIDITNNLGKNDPHHIQCDIRNTIPMAILYYLEQFGKVPERYEKHC